MTAPVFVDTNVFIYALDAGNPGKQQAAMAWREELWKSRRGRVSFQVLQEFYANVSRLWPEFRSQARTEIRDLLAWVPAVTDAAILDHAWIIQDRFQLSFWDALIVAAAKSASCRYLLTEDLQTGRALDGLVIVNPFQTNPTEIPS